MQWDLIGKSARLGGVEYYGVTITIYLSMVTVPHKMVGLERMSDYRGFTLSKHEDHHSVVEFKNN